VVRLVTFDAHGTLIVPHPGVGPIYAEVARQYGLERDPAELDAAFGAAFRGVRSEWKAAGRPAYGADDDDARRFWIRVVETTFAEPLPSEVAWECYDTFATAARWRVLPNVREALALVARRGLPMAVVSNFDCRLPPLLAEMGLGPFVTVVVSAQVGRAKPDPAPLLAACRAGGCEPAETLHVGDSADEDGACCAAAGARWLPCAPGQGIPLAELAAMLADP
jgi:putative hydrolase of the HAD superfamily